MCLKQLKGWTVNSRGLHDVGIPSLRLFCDRRRCAFRYPLEGGIRFRRLSPKTGEFTQLIPIRIQLKSILLLTQLEVTKE
jgi:hypothetical protein